jgi:flagellar biosynthesis GTPase FlhF
MKITTDQISGSSSEHNHPEQATKMNCVIEGLKSLGGKDQLIMFLTGPAGAGKTTYGACEQFRTFIEHLKRIEYETLDNS